MTTQNELVKIARTGGIWYLLLAVSGVLGFLVYHQQIFVSGEPETTLSNLVEMESKARIRLLLEFIIILSQALTAIWFYRLFKNIKEWAALSIAIWGSVNAVIIMLSAISMAAAINIAASEQVLESKIAMIDLLSRLISNSWNAGGLFFGLWLLPIGYLITSSKRMPVWLGRTLLLGGIGYILSSLLYYGGVKGSWVGMLSIPATVGEFWLIGYLLIFGIRPEDSSMSK